MTFFLLNFFFGEHGVLNGCSTNLYCRIKNVFIVIAFFVLRQECERAESVEFFLCFGLLFG